MAWALTGWRDRASIARDAQQLRVGVAGADRVLVEVRMEVRMVVAGIVAALRVARFGLHESPPAPAGGERRGAARVSIPDRRGARRALVAAGSTGHVRTCSQTHHKRGRRSMYT